MADNTARHELKLRIEAADKEMVAAIYALDLMSARAALTRKEHLVRKFVRLYGEGS
jgi:hypothetical protein